MQFSCELKQQGAMLAISRDLFSANQIGARFPSANRFYFAPID